MNHFNMSNYTFVQYSSAMMLKINFRTFRQTRCLHMHEFSQQKHEVNIHTLYNLEDPVNSFLLEHFVLLQ